MKHPIRELPLFPLPGLLFYPGRLLSLHIFEPRYRALMRASLGADRRFAMAVLRPGWEPEYEANPPIFDLVGVGRITKYQELPDGRFLLLLMGEMRARVLEERTGEEYRVGRIAPMEETPVPKSEENSLRKQLTDQLRRVLGKIPAPPECDSSPDSRRDPRTIEIADEALLGLPLTIERKLEIFGLPCHGDRIAAVVEAVASLDATRCELDRTRQLDPHDSSFN